MDPVSVAILSLLGQAFAKGAMTTGGSVAVTRLVGLTQRTPSATEVFTATAASAILTVRRPVEEPPGGWKKVRPRKLERLLLTHAYADAAPIAGPGDQFVETFANQEAIESADRQVTELMCASWLMPVALWLGAIVTTAHPVDDERILEAVGMPNPADQEEAWKRWIAAVVAQIGSRIVNDSRLVGLRDHLYFLQGRADQQADTEAVRDLTRVLSPLPILGATAAMSLTLIAAVAVASLIGDVLHGPAWIRVVAAGFTVAVIGAEPLLKRLRQLALRLHIQRLAGILSEATRSAAAARHRQVQKLLERLGNQPRSIDEVKNLIDDTPWKTVVALVLMGSITVARDHNDPRAPITLTLSAPKSLEGPTTSGG